METRRFLLPWFVFGTVLLLFIGWLLWDLSSGVTEQRIRGEQTNSRHIEYAEGRIKEVCYGLELGSLSDCIHQEIQSALDHSRSEQDLDAQQTMALFTKIMGVTALLGALLGLGSIVLIYWTLTATQKMARDTREIGEAQARAYLSFEFTKILTRSPNLSRDHAEAVEPNLTVEIVGRVENSGQSPANKISFHFFIGDELPGPIVYSKDNLHRVKSVSHSIPARGSFENQTLKRTFAAPLDELGSGERLLCFLIIVEWKDVFGKIIRSEPSFGTIEWQTDANGNRRVHFGNESSEEEAVKSMSL